ncbi:hypothetical protein CKK33_01005 [Mucilaginibacter sp. MD40]|uniref:DUF4488 domain-containing protein n=1 Tax=Mucilaginibacter sp. MD40 TaxID=2029590 RepID=UPI000BACDA9A|nr:DUF4488 domain-containing protein [Mucilaginibacter sp. MD40]PAW92147.1 hypothetical protein CKK33_01005 [Mucilaginibacter sp. MD40]
MLKKSFRTLAMLVMASTAFSCKTAEKAHQKKVKSFVGTWNDADNPTNKIVFNADGRFYNINTENGLQIVTHSGTFKILSDSTYTLNITDARPNAMYDLKGRQYANHYALSSGKKTMKINGVVDGRNGVAPLAWSTNLVKVN